MAVSGHSPKPWGLQKPWRGRSGAGDQRPAGSNAKAAPLKTRPDLPSVQAPRPRPCALAGERTSTCRASLVATGTPTGGFLHYRLPRCLVGKSPDDRLICLPNTLGKDYRKGWVTSKQGKRSFMTRIAEVPGCWVIPPDFEHPPHMSATVPTGRRKRGGRPGPASSDSPEMAGRVLAPPLDFSPCGKRITVRRAGKGAGGGGWFPEGKAPELYRRGTDLGTDAYGASYRWLQVWRSQK